MGERLSQKIEALSIILAAPLWPRRDMLGEAGQALFDRIVADAKRYALMVATEEFDAALMMAASWAPYVNRFMDEERIAGNEDRERMCRVFCHYASAVGDLSQIEKGRGDG